jgi:hypothetical protein
MLAASASQAALQLIVPSIHFAKFHRLWRTFV